nr:MAG TPA: hypothetical protein [Caudoviricetes sp.]
MQKLQGIVAIAITTLLQGIAVHCICTKLSYIFTILQLQCNYNILLQSF